MKNAPKPEGADDDGQQTDTPMNQDLHRLFLMGLADILNAEDQLTAALPVMAAAAESPELAEAFNAHLEETQEHVNRLNQVFESLNEQPTGRRCRAMESLIEEGSQLIKELKGNSALDAGLIAAAQKVEHYEIACYGSLLAWAEQMGHEDAADLLEDTLEEEKATDDKLSELSDSLAASEGEDE